MPPPTEIGLNKKSLSGFFFLSLADFSLLKTKITTEKLKNNFGGSKMALKVRISCKCTNRDLFNFL